MHNKEIIILAVMAIIYIVAFIMLRIAYKRQKVAYAKALFSIRSLAFWTAYNEPRELYNNSKRNEATGILELKGLHEFVKWLEFESENKDPYKMIVWGDNYARRLLAECGSQSELDDRAATLKNIFYPMPAFKPNMLQRLFLRKPKNDSREGVSTPAETTVSDPSSPAD